VGYVIEVKKMAKNVLIAGAPGIGKTSLISRLYRDLTPLFIRGFYKEAIHEYRLLKGYRLATFDFQELILAHVHIVGPERIGQFGLNLDGFNELITHQLTPDPKVELFLVDEIGMMECTSLQFRHMILKVMDSEIPLIATLASHDVLDILKIKKRKDISILNMTYKNRDSIWKNVLVEISKPLP
jgi:nucleoside-triphosphatase